MGAWMRGWIGGPAVPWLHTVEGRPSSACPTCKLVTLSTACWRGAKLLLLLQPCLQMCAVVDVAHGLKAFTAFFDTISELDRTGEAYLGW